MQKPSGYDETKEVTISGGEIAGNARKELEAKLGRTVISSSNATMPELLDDSKKSEISNTSLDLSHKFDLDKIIDMWKQVISSISNNESKLVIISSL